MRTSAGRSAIPGSVGDYGWTGIYGTQFWVDPREQMYVVLMATLTLAIMTRADHVID